jgi:two-component system response regulator DevR
VAAQADPCHADHVSTPIRLFVVSAALAIRRALAHELDAEVEIVVVGEARSSAEALARVPAARPDVVLAGAHLTDPDSPEMCRQLLAAVPGLHVLMVGADASQELIAAAYGAGAVGVVPHTIDDDELVEAIEMAAAGRMVASADALTALLRAEQVRRDADPLDQLTPLEGELFELVGQGLSNAEIAARLGLTNGTVRNYVSRLLRKLNVERRAQVVAMAARRDATGRSSG